MAHRAGSDGASIVSAKPIEKPGCQSWEGGDSGGTRLYDKLIVLPKKATAHPPNELSLPLSRPTLRHADYDNGAELQRLSRCRRCEVPADLLLAAVARRREQVLPPSGEPTQVGATPGIRFRAVVGARKNRSVVSGAGDGDAAGTWGDAAKLEAFFGFFVS
jgi:hypothetical protein